MLGCCYAHRFHPAVPGAALRSAGKSMKYTGGCGRAAAGAAQGEARPGGHGDRVTNIMGELSIIFGCSTKCTSWLCWGMAGAGRANVIMALWSQA